MNETERHPEEQARPRVEETAWQTPDYVVVETALEVTAYSLNAR
jgi:coenzyme PQQ precursor peptide PqqA